MEALFAALSKRQSMLLLTAVTFGGQDSLESFSHLPEDERELLSQRAQHLLAIPRERRIPLLVQEMKRLVLVRRGQLWSTEPERLATLLMRERPALVEVVLRALPAGLADSVRAYLPPGASAKLEREVRPEVLNLIRWKLEEQLAREGREAGFKFSDVVLLRLREVITVCDRLGARALVPVMNGVPDHERRAFIEALPPDQRMLLRAALEAEPERKLTEEEARELLAAHEPAKTPPDILRSFGAQRLARACLAQSPEYAQRLVERHPGEFGILLARWVREERPKVVGKADAGRADIVADLERLAQKGVVDRPVRLPSKKNNEGTKSLTSQGTRLPPPRRREVDALSPSGEFRAPASSRERGDAAIADVSHRIRAREGGFRDPIAEREARKAGIPVPVGPPPPLTPRVRAPPGPGERRGLRSAVLPSAWEEDEKTEETDAVELLAREMERSRIAKPPVLQTPPRRREHSASGEGSRLSPSPRVDTDKENG